MLSPNVERLKNRHNTRGLIKALRHRDEKIRQAAAQALGEILYPQALEALIAALQHDPEPNVRQAAAQALGQMIDPQALEALTAVLQHDQKPNVRQAAVMALGKLGQTKTVKPLLAALRDESPDVRLPAVAALVDLGEISVGPLSRVIKSDPSGDVRQTAALALQNLGWKPEEAFETGIAYWLLTGQWEKCFETSIPAIAIGPLTSILQSRPFLRVCQDAVKALGKIRDPRVVKPVIEALEDENLRDVAAQVLIDLDQLAIGPLSTLLKSHSFWKVRQAAAKILGQIGVSAKDALWTVLQRDDDIRIRLACYSALETIPGVRVEETVVTDLVESTAEALRSLYSRKKTEQVLTGHTTETHYTAVGPIYCLSPRSVATAQNELMETEAVPVYEDKRVSDPDHQGIMEIISLIPVTLRDAVEKLSGEVQALGYFDRA